jgi:hypothetical protein
MFARENIRYVFLSLAYFWKSHSQRPFQYA